MGRRTSIEDARGRKIAVGSHVHYIGKLRLGPHPVHKEPYVVTEIVGNTVTIAGLGIRAGHGVSATDVMAIDSPGKSAHTHATHHAKRKPARTKRGKKLVVEYAVAGLSNAQIDSLTGYAVAQGEASDYDEEFGAVNYPDVAVTSRVAGRGKQKRLVVTYDVRGLSEDQVDSLAGAAIAQGEANDAGLIIGGVPQNVQYPDVAVTSKVI